MIVAACARPSWCEILFKSKEHHSYLWTLALIEWQVYTPPSPLSDLKNTAVYINQVKFVPKKKQVEVKARGAPCV